MFKTNFLARACGAVLTATALMCAGASHAAITNGSFGSGLTGWSVAGNAAVDTIAFFGPPAGGAAAHAVMGTAGTGGYLFGGSATAVGNLDTLTGMPAGSFAALGAVVGSAIKQSFTSNAGDVLSFNWKFMSDEPQNSPANDTAFMVLDGKLFQLSTVQTAAFVGSSGSPMFDETAYVKFTSDLLAAGAHTVSFGVVDVPDTLGASALAVSNVSVSAVPEPRSWALMLAGAAVLGGLLRRRGTPAR